MRFLAAVLTCLLAGCAHRAPPRLRTPPNDHVAWRSSLNTFAARLFGALRDSQLEPVLVSYADLDAFLTPSARIRVEHERSGHRPSLLEAAASRAWARASYVGFCIQGAHSEPAKHSYGLLADAWIVDRVLVVARRGRSRTASWVEGTFLYTDQGWKALSVSRIEPPRSHHTDLEVAPCDVEYGIR
jgi:hypothetical protein